MISPEKGMNMANIQKTGEAPLQGSNGDPDMERLAAQVKQLQTECEKLRQSLARTEAERDHYLKAIYAYERAKLEFEDIDIAELEKASAGPVELIE